jgi:hypothetical protein
MPDSDLVNVICFLLPGRGHSRGSPATRAGLLAFFARVRLHEGQSGVCGSCSVWHCGTRRAQVGLRLQPRQPQNKITAPIAGSGDGGHGFMVNLGSVPA